MVIVQLKFYICDNLSTSFIMIFQQINKLSLENQTLDLESLNSNHLIPEVAVLLEEMRQEKGRMNSMHETGIIGRGRSSNESKSNRTDLGSAFRVDLKEFTALVKKCLSFSGGEGKGVRVKAVEGKEEIKEKGNEFNSPYAFTSAELATARLLMIEAECHPNPLLDKESMAGHLDRYGGLHGMSESKEHGLELEEEQEQEQGQGQGRVVEQGEGEVLLMHVRTAEDKVKDIKYIKSLSARAVARKSAAIKVHEGRCTELGIPCFM